jgi:hypothetical protein
VEIAPPALSAAQAAAERAEDVFELAVQGRVGRLLALRAVVVHHSASPLHTSLVSIEGTHLREGYATVGYHAVILGKGELVHCRPLPIAGAHAPRRNADSIGLCIVGDNRFEASRWVPAQTETARRYLDALELIAPGLELIGHRDVRATLCPGMSTAELRALLGR